MSGSAIYVTTQQHENFTKKEFNLDLLWNVNATSCTFTVNQACMQLHSLFRVVWNGVYFNSKEVMLCSICFDHVFYPLQSRLQAKQEIGRNAASRYTGIFYHYLTKTSKKWRSFNGFLYQCALIVQDLLYPRFMSLCIYSCHLCSKVAWDWPLVFTRYIRCNIEDDSLRGIARILQRNGYKDCTECFCRLGPFYGEGGAG